MSSDQAKSSKESPTNVTRFCRALETAQVLEDGTEIQQVIMYQKGVGTGDMNWLQKQMAGEYTPQILSYAIILSKLLF